MSGSCIHTTHVHPTITKCNTKTTSFSGEHVSRKMRITCIIEETNIFLGIFNITVRKLLTFALGVVLAWVQTLNTRFPQNQTINFNVLWFYTATIMTFK